MPTISQKTIKLFEDTEFFLGLDIHEFVFDCTGDHYIRFFIGTYVYHADEAEGWAKTDEFVRSLPRNMYRWLRADGECDHVYLPTREMCEQACETYILRLEKAGFLHAERCYDIDNGNSEKIEESSDTPEASL